MKLSGNMEEVFSVSVTLLISEVLWRGVVFRKRVNKISLQILATICCHFSDFLSTSIYRMLLTLEKFYFSISKLRHLKLFQHVPIYCCISAASSIYLRAFAIKIHLFSLSLLKIRCLSLWNWENSMIC